MRWFAPSLLLPVGVLGVTLEADFLKARQASSSASPSAESESIPVLTTVESTASAAPSAIVSVAVKASTNATTAASFAGNVKSTILVVATDDGKSSAAGLNGYGIPYQVVTVPQAGITLPTLNDTNGGNYGGILVVGQVSYDYGGTTGFASALTTDQWNQLYAYQLAYGVRMVHLNVFPGPAFGATDVGSCCDGNTEQEVYFTDTTDFPQAGLKTGTDAGVSTIGLFHYTASVSDTTTTKEIAQFAASGSSGPSTAAVISNFSGREQMAWFVSWDLTWSATNSFLQHAWIQWMTRGLYAGQRRTNLNTQIDDMFLETDIYVPANTTYRVTTSDMDVIKAWVPTLNSKLNPGSSYFPEVGFNGNGCIEQAEDTRNGDRTCTPGSIEYPDQIDTALEFVKPCGSGTNQWPATPTNYTYSSACPKLDPLGVWWANLANANNFAGITHTFTHLELDNATYSDAYKEIVFNIAFMDQIGISSMTHFTSNGLIPPAITGLHNCDVLRAWHDAGLDNCVGDNTRPPLVNQQNDCWPYFTSLATDGYDGFQVNPRWALRIFYNCYNQDCCVSEWINTSGGAGVWADLIAADLADFSRHQFGLHHDPNMFHQANLRATGVPAIPIKGLTTNSVFSLFQAWVETTTAEFVRLVNWPLITLKHADMSAAFLARYTRDQCGYGMSYTISNAQITGVTVTANGNTCSSPIPVTFPGTVTNTQGFKTEQVGNDPLTVWVQLSGSPVTFTLSSPVAL